MICPVCGKKSEYLQCPQCGFDSSRNYEQYPTLAPVKKAPAVSALRKEWEKAQQTVETPKKKKNWLPLVACVAMLVIGIAIGAGFGGKQASPEPSGDVQIQVPSETTQQVLPPETTMQTVPPATETEGAWRENVLRSDLPKVTGVYVLLPGWCSSAPVFDSDYRREQIQSVTFLNTLADAPQDAWDVSEAGDGKVLAWVTPNGDLYDLYIGAEGGIAAGKSCFELFRGYSNVEYFSNMEFLHTENVQNMGGIFRECHSITSLDVSTFDTSSVQDMSYMFSNCTSLTSLDVSAFDTGNVQTTTGMFSGCSSLTDLDVSAFDTGNLQTTEYMFSGCSSLTDLDVSALNTGNVQNMGGMFEACSSLTDLDVSSFNTENVQDMRFMFYACSSLTNLDLSSFDTANVQNMGSMFRDCRALTNLNVNGFDTRNVQEMWYMFCGCRSLSSLDLSSFDTGAVEDTTFMFYDCPAGDDWQHLLK